MTNDTDKTGDLKPLLAKVADGHSLSESEAAGAFDIMMSGTRRRRKSAPS